MFSRRNLFKSLLGFLVAPKVAKSVVHQPAVKYLSPLVGYNSKIVYAPYIPLMITKEIKAEDFSKRSGMVMAYYPATVKDIRKNV